MLLVVPKMNAADAVATVAAFIVVDYAPDAVDSFLGKHS